MPLSPTDVFIIVFGAGILLFAIGFGLITIAVYIRDWVETLRSRRNKRG